MISDSLFGTPAQPYLKTTKWMECVRLLAFAHEGDLRGKKGVAVGRSVGRGRSSDESEIFSISETVRRMSNLTTFLMSVSLLTFNLKYRVQLASGV